MTGPSTLREGKRKQDFTQGAKKQDWYIKAYK